MNVIHVTKFYHPSRGGIETYVKSLAEGVVRKGGKSSVVCFSQQRSLKTHRENINGVEVIRIPTLGILRSQPIPFGLFPKISIEDRGKTVMHLHTPFPQGELFSLGKAFTDIPMVATWCADVASTRWRRFSFPLGTLSRAVVRKAKYICPIGPNIAENSPTLTPVLSKVRPLFLGITPRTAYAESAKSLESSRAPRVLFVGRLRLYKGVENLIRAAHLFSGFQIDVVGKGEELPRLRELCGELSLNERVSFHGEVSDAELDRLYSTADLFVLPSISESEALGLVQIEAMARGLPVINTWLKSAVPEVSIDGQTGLTCAPNEPEQLASAIEQILGDAEKYSAFSANAIKRSKELSEETMLANYQSIYESALSESSKPVPHV